MMVEQHRRLESGIQRCEHGGSQWTVHWNVEFLRVVEAPKTPVAARSLPEMAFASRVRTSNGRRLNICGWWAEISNAGKSAPFFQGLLSWNTSAAFAGNSNSVFRSAAKEAGLSVGLRNVTIPRRGDHAAQ